MTIQPIHINPRKMDVYDGRGPRFHIESICYGDGRPQEVSSLEASLRLTLFDDPDLSKTTGILKELFDSAD